MFWLLLVRRGCIGWGKQQKTNSDSQLVQIAIAILAVISAVLCKTLEAFTALKPLTVIVLHKQIVFSQWDPLFSQAVNVCHESGMIRVVQWDALGWFQGTGLSRQARLLSQVRCSLLSSHLYKNWSFPFIFYANSFLSGLLSYCLLHAVFLIPFSFSLFPCLPREFHVSSAQLGQMLLLSITAQFPLLLFSQAKVLVWVFSKEYTFAKRRLLTLAVIWSHVWPFPKVSHISPISQNIYCFPD